MSLINEMLKDLDARGDGDVPEHVRVARPERARGRGLVIALALLATAAAGVAAYLWQQQSALPPAVQAVVVPTIEAARASPPAETVVPAGLMAQPANDAAAAETTPKETNAIATTIAPASVPPDTRDQAPLPVEPVEATTGSAPPEATVESATMVASAEEDTMIIRRAEPTPAEKAARAAREGFAALRRGDWAAAARLLQELVAMEPANDDAREGLVIALTRQGRISEADGALLDGLAVANSPARFAKLRARLQAARGELDAALGSLAIAVPTVSADPEYHALKAALAQQAGHYDVALASYRALTAFEPANATWQAGLAMALDGSGDYVAAREAYRRALDIGGIEPALHEHVRRRLSALDGDAALQD